MYRRHCRNNPPRICSKILVTSPPNSFFPGGCCKTALDSVLQLGIVSLYPKSYPRAIPGYPLERIRIGPLEDRLIPSWITLHTGHDPPLHTSSRAGRDRQRARMSVAQEGGERTTKQCAGRGGRQLRPSSHWAACGRQPASGLGSQCGCSRGSGRGLDDIAFRLEHNRWESHLATLVVQLHHLLCGVSGDSERSCEINPPPALTAITYVIHDGTVPARYCLLQKSK